MDALFAQFQKLPIDKSLISLEPGSIEVSYFCYPVNAVPIGFEGCTCTRWPKTSPIFSG